jgi:hypothetical protein
LSDGLSFVYRGTFWNDQRQHVHLGMGRQAADRFAALLEG